MAKLIVCDLPTDKKNDDTPERCPGIVAHQVGSRMIDIKRGKEGVLVVGDNFNMTVTCPRCGRKHAIVCAGGTIDETGLTFREEKDAPKPNEEPSDEGGE